MKLPLRRHRNLSRGQALVEFALILPVLVLLLLLATDFGRVFFGWVALNNATRIGANEAAKAPTPWALGGSDPLYYEQIAHDLEAINCDADVNNDSVIDQNDLPAPVFSDNVQTASPYEVGDLVSVTLHCDFGFLTPLVGNIVGDPLTITATTTFLVSAGEIAGIPIPPDPIPAGCIGTDSEVPNLKTMTVAQARAAWAAAGFTGPLSPAPGVADDNIVLTQATTPTSSPGDCLIYTANVTVTHKVPDSCAVTEGTVPPMVGLTVAGARAAWAGAGFTGGFTPLTGSDTDIVSDFSILPVDVDQNGCAAYTSQINVTHAPPTPPVGQCNMVQVLGFTPAAAQAAYVGQSFTGTFTTQPADKPSWKVKSQTLIGGQAYACTANLEVSLENK